MLEIDNQRLSNENDQLKQICLCKKNIQLEKLPNSLQRSNVINDHFFPFFLSINLIYSNMIKQLKLLKMILTFINVVLSNRYTHYIIFIVSKSFV